MAKFEYVTTAADGTASSISPDLLMTKLLQKSISSLVRDTDDKFFAIDLADGSAICFTLGDVGCEIRWEPPDTK